MNRARRRLAIFTDYPRIAVHAHSIRNVILLLDKEGCTPRVALARDKEEPVEIPAAAFLSALPL